MTVAYYISSHGFGHIVRAAEVMKALDPAIPLLLRTAAPEWFIRQELAGRSYELIPAQFDCGVLGQDHTINDAALTFGRMAEIQRENETQLEAELELLRARGVRVVVSDIAPFALRAAKEAGLRSILITNFTWTEIYRTMVEELRAGGNAELADLAGPVLAQVELEYAMGETLLVPGMALPMTACREQTTIPIIARRGRDRRAEICRALGFDSARPLYLLYLGHAGYTGLDWSAVGQLADAQFFTFGGAHDAASGVRSLPEGAIGHADAVASCDAVVGKLGYSLCAECAAAGKALVFPPRVNFAEASALRAAMLEFGLAVEMSDAEFKAGRWAEPLRRAAELSRAARPREREGARAAADAIQTAYRS